MWGGGTLSSSDGQLFSQRGRSLTARALSRYLLDEGATPTSTSRTRTPPTAPTSSPITVSRGRRRARRDLRQSDRPAHRRAHRRHRPTNPGHVRHLLHRGSAVLGPDPRQRPPPALPPRPGRTWRDRYPHTGTLLTQPIQTQLIIDHWPDLLRLVDSMKFGHTTASLLIAKLHANSGQNVTARRARVRPTPRQQLPLPLRRRRRAAPPSPAATEQGREPPRAVSRPLLRPSRPPPAMSPRRQVDQALCLTLITNAGVL